MSNTIKLTLKINKPEDWIYAQNKPYNKYELQYYDEEMGQIRTLMNASLQTLFRQFFLLKGNFHVNYILEPDTSNGPIKPEMQDKIQRKFQLELDNLDRRLLGLSKEDPLPIGQQREVALQAAFEKRKTVLVGDLKENIQRTKRFNNIILGLDALLVIGAIVFIACVAAAVLTNPGVIALIAPLLCAGILGSTITYLMGRSISKSCNSEITKIKNIKPDDPIIIDENVRPFFSPEHSYPYYNTPVKVTPEINAKKLEAETQPKDKPKTNPKPRR